MIEALERDHRLIGELADRLEECIDDPSAAALVRIGQLRWALAREVVRHNQMEEQLVYAEMSQSDPDTLARHYQAFPYARTDTFLQRLKLHIHYWSNEAMVQNREDYAHSCREILTILRARMALEERVLYPRMAEIQRAKEGRAAIARATVVAPTEARPPTEVVVERDTKSAGKVLRFR